MYRDKNDPRAKESKKRWYYKNKEKQLKRQSERRKKLLDWFYDYKKTLLCSECGMDFKEYPECCDFHHIDDNKEGSMRAMACSSESKLIKEIKKCIPLCANCHRKLHADERRLCRSVSKTD